MKKYEMVYKHILNMIQNKTLRTGDKIPSIRKTARNLKVGILTVIEGYKRLELDGMIFAKAQSGFFVTPLSSPEKRIKRPIEDATTLNMPNRIIKAKTSDYVDTLLNEAANPAIVSFGSGIPHPDFFPSKALALSIGRVTRNRPNAVNTYELSPGNLDLRQEVAKHIANAGANIGPDDICITTGGTAGIILALMSTYKKGQAVAIESPGYFGFYSAAELLNIPIIEIASDPKTGLVISDLERALKKHPNICALLLSCNVSNPTGASIPEINKKRVVDIAHKHKITILEDETYADLTFSNNRNRSIKAFSQETVISFGSFNKILAPGYRIGWISGGNHHKDIIRNFNAMYLSVPAVTQAAICSFLKNEGLRKHLRNIKQKYRLQSEIFASEICESFPLNTRIAMPGGGHFLWVEIPGGNFDSRELADQAIRHNISIAPGSIFSSSQKHKRFFRINCACKWNTKTKKAVHKLGRLIKDMI